MLRGIRPDGDTTVVALQGVVQFSGAEAVLHRLAETPVDDSEIVLDLSRVDRFSDVGRRMTLEGLRRLALDGHTVAVVDPDGVLPDPDLGDGTRPQVRSRPAAGG
ncbi:STAS domain-containing protein [Pseudonocardia sp. NPDC046786]|uniref:STAS domain-containing protein n=1 Tax=Pseudonocardia sp. NPDC046786 TaxID=3155471 RepID=UPI0033E9FB8C